MEVLRTEEVDQYYGVARLYDYIINTDVNYTEYIKVILRSIQEHYPDLKNAVLGDIGGGTGSVTFQIHDQVKKIIMIEPSHAMLNIAKSKFNPNNHTNVELRQGGFPSCGLEENSMDIIISVNDPFHYLLSLNEQLLALKDIYKSLKQGGLLFIDNMNFFSLIRSYRWPKMREININNKKITWIDQHDIFPIKEQWVHTYNIFVENNETQEIKKIVSKHTFKMISPTEMRLLFKETGFIKNEIITPPRLGERGSSRMWCFAYKP
jgi:ubiquinone/menaquinone biosynthesis C-methylase UbiE